MVIVHEGETCSHVGAILYSLEAQVRIREDTPCTSKENTWILPTAVKDIPYLMLEDIDFTSAEKKMKCMQKGVSCNPTNFSEPTKFKPPTDEELSDFFTEVAKETFKKPVLLSLIVPHNNQFAQSSVQLPLPLQSIFDPKHLELDYLQLLGLATEYIPNSVSTTQQEHLEEVTRSQSKSKVWFKFRAGRITGSRVYQVVHTDPHKLSSLLSSICYPEACKFSSATSKYGCQHEKDAVEAYKLKLHSGTHDQPMVTPCGFVVSTHKPHFGAPPYAFVECNCCGRRVLEVKCPFCARSSAVLDLPNFCLTKDKGSSLHLKRDHAYYYQCQLQLYATQRLYCDFVVWTEANLHIERIIKDKLFLKEIIP